MSSGESWALSVIPELIARRGEDITVIVDEPESYLNEQLVSQFWSKIENDNPTWKFVYATHNPSFAARENVDDIYLLKSSSEEPVLLDVLDNMPEEQRQLLFGIAPKLLASKKTLFVEGRDQSFDRAFYDVVTATDVAIQPLKGCNDVIKAATHTSYWKYLPLGEITVRGVVDRDYRSVSENTSLVSSAAGALHCLGRHDAEAYLAEPKLIACIATHISGPEQDLKTYENSILEYAANNLFNTLRAFANNVFSFRRTISTSKSELASLDVDEIVESYIAKRDQLLAHVSTKASDDEDRNQIVAIKHRLESAISERNFEAILTDFNGKAIFSLMMPLAGLSSRDQAVRVIADKELVEQFPHLLGLRGDLANLFAA